MQSAEVKQKWIRKQKKMKEEMKKSADWKGNHSLIHDCNKCPQRVEVILLRVIDEENLHVNGHQLAFFYISISIEF